MIKDEKPTGGLLKNMEIQMSRPRAVAQINILIQTIWMYHMADEIAANSRGSKSGAAVSTQKIWANWPT